MDRAKVLEDNLRKAACEGDFDLVFELFSKNTCVNTRHVINGWTPLHWAAKRGRTEIVKLLLENGADPTITTEKGETAAALATNPDIRQLLGDMNGTNGDSNNIPITPNYIKNPPLNSKEEFNHWTNGSIHRRPIPPTQDSDELVLKVRVANGGDPDFIEVEILKAELNYYSLLRTCCEELGINASQVVRIRKLPNTMLRKDKDVQRLNQMQEIEVVVTPASITHQPNGYKSIQLYKNQTILY
ncbi:ankyrin repeat domain-containing protein 40-like [Cimex lectularius]|uniref:Ankyrin repeat domain-containing protein 40 n=1 Tax=Cimex lectularius TaxID=79782 RepID=A0A8I6R8F7_CIMLE|nr:ankyrin repeat domain-containing protein 40-like [Cimex lectularius]